MRKIKKCVFTLATDGYEPELMELTLPLMKRYADKIRAEFYVIKDRKHPAWPIQCEKLQIYSLAQEMENDWNIYFDSDALIHPEMLDVTILIPKDTVMHNACDMANVRWAYDQYFLRDGRHIGSCNWFTVASDWCIDLWRFPEELGPEQCAANILPTVDEELTGMKTSMNLIDDYLIARNIARFNLKFKAFATALQEMGMGNSFLLWHQYTKGPEHKLAEAIQVLKGWKLTQEYGK
jgi:hypothetical protein